MGHLDMVPANSATGSLSLSLPESLERLVHDQTKTVFAAPDSVNEAFATKTVPWKVPAVVAEADRLMAANHLPAAQAACDPAPKDKAMTWLATLGTLVAGNMPAAEAQIRLKAYTGLLQIPAGMMTREVLDRAARRFKWFPAYAELAEFVDQERDRLEQRANRLRIIAQSGDAGRPQPDRQRGGMKPISAAVKRPDQTTPHRHAELTEGLSGDQARAYWGARLEGKEPSEARAIATGTQVQEPA